MQPSSSLGRLCRKKCSCTTVITSLIIICTIDACSKLTRGTTIFCPRVESVGEDGSCATISQVFGVVSGIRVLSALITKASTAAVLERALRASWAAVLAALRVWVRNIVISKIFTLSQAHGECQWICSSNLVNRRVLRIKRKHVQSVVTLSTKQSRRGNIV